MEKDHRKILRRCRQKIVDDLDVSDILDSLLENEILDEEQVEVVQGKATRAAKARCLLDTLPARGPRAFQVFLQSLKENYSWLVELMERTAIDARHNTQEAVQLSDLLLRGGVPNPPSNTIPRQKELDSIKDGLSSLTSGRFLAVHGMPGSGKSVLAAESVRDPQVTLNNFSGGVFWFKVGMVDSDQLLGRLRALCTKLDAAHLPSSIEEAQEILRKLFLSPQYSDSLLILDDVWSPMVVRTFTLPVRVMVTTQDVSVMEVVRDLFTVVEIRSGFTESESLDLFSSYLRVPQEYLPAEARDIHAECKGSPMVISLIGSLISESGRSQRTQRQSGRWSYYLQNLKSRRYSKLRQDNRQESVMGAVGMSVDNLDEADRQKYEQLAVFLDDDPIPTKTLEILWNTDRYDVEDTMNRFLKKSLAMCEVDREGELVYTLHDLQLDYLKTRLRDDPAKEQNLHEQFVSQYLRRVNYRYGDIEDDGYIFSHTGYHLHKAGMDQLFPELYLDLGYVEASLKATGPVELLADYRKYGHIIEGPTGPHSNSETLADFAEFCRTVGTKVSSNPDADIIQLALREVEASSVYQAARLLADQRPDTLYLEWRNRANVQSQCIASILHPGGPKVVRFLPDHRVATATSEGAILIWNVEAGQVMERLSGHRAEVICLSLFGEEGLVSGDEDGNVREWRPRPVEEDGGIASAATVSRKKNSRKKNLRLRSPSLAPGSSLEQMFEEREQRDDSIAGLEVVGGEEEGVLALAARPGSREVAVGGRAGTVRVYDLGIAEAPTVCLLRGHSEPVNSLEYSSRGDRLASGSDDTTVRLWSSAGEFLASLHLHRRRVTQVRWLGGASRLATLSMEQILVWDSPGRGIDTTVLTRNKASSWTCLAASEDCVAAGTAEDKMVIVWAAATGQVVFALPGQTSPVTSLDFSSDGEYLASSSEEHLVVWGVGLTEGGLEQQPLSLGPPHMTRWRGRIPITAAPDDTNSVAVLNYGNVEHRSPVQEGAVMALELSVDCTLVVFGTVTGSVRSYSTVTGAVTELGRHKGPVTSVAVTRDGGTVVSAATDRTVKVFQVDRKEVVLEGHREAVRDVRLVGAREDKVLSCSVTGRLKIWNISTGELALDIDSGYTDHATCLDTVLREGEGLAAVAGVVGGVKVVELQGGQCLLQVGPANCPVRVVRFSPDGGLVVTGHDTGAVQIWDSHSGLALSSPLSLHSSWVTDLSISSDCSTLLTAGDRLVWWLLPPSCPPAPALPTPPSSTLPARRKLSLPLPRARRSSGGSKRDSLQLPDDVSLPDCRVRATSRDPMAITASRGSSGYGSPVGSYGTPPGRESVQRRLLPSQLPSSPVGKRKIHKRGAQGRKELLQTFDVKGSLVNKVWVSPDFTQFVTVDDAGICYILDEYIPAVNCLS